MFIILIRTVILYFIVIIAMRLMGKKQIGQLEPFELAITIMISELASLPMQDTRIPLLHGIIPIVTLLLLQISLAAIQLKSEYVRKLLNSQPSILIKDGKINIEELRYQKFNINDLMEELRLKGFYNIEEIQYAILETSGQLSIIPKTDSTPVTKEDLNIEISQDELPITLILDGKINTYNLNLINKDINWLNKKLQENDAKNCSEIFLALLNSKQDFYCQKKSEK